MKMNNDMKITIYYHNDFDGIASAGIFSNFLSWLYSEAIFFNYNSMDYDVVFNFLKKDLKTETVVLDYPFHPQAKWWFDHHKTSFYSEKIKKHYSKGKFHYWNTRSKSCPSLLFSTFKKYYLEYYKLNYLKYKELVIFSNIIDSALYRNPKEPYDFDNNFIAFNHILNSESSNKIRLEFIESIKNVNFNLFFHSPWFANKKEQLISDFNSVVSLLRNRISLIDNIALVELDDYSDLSFSTRFISYYFYPNIDYTIIKSKRNDLYYLGVGYNPWKSANEINIGAYLKQFGGGGRKNVGAILTKDEVKFINLTSQITQYFSKRLWM